MSEKKTCMLQKNKKGKKDGRQNSDKCLFWRVHKGVRTKWKPSTESCSFHAKKKKQRLQPSKSVVMSFETETLGIKAADALVICRMLVYLWRGQLPQGRSKGSSLANPACNKQYNATLLPQTPLHQQVKPKCNITQNQNELKEELIRYRK